jgi:TrmH family RNA methyltransferase
MEAVGAQTLFLLDDSADPYHPSAVRASMGALFWIPIVQAAFDDFAPWVKQHSCRVYGTSAHASREFRRLPAYQRPCILLLGSERTGLTADQAAICVEMLRLPMQGRATSLNLAVAAGVMLYDMHAKILPAGTPNVNP